WVGIPVLTADTVALALRTSTFGMAGSSASTLGRRTGLDPIGSLIAPYRATIRRGRTRNFRAGLRVESPPAHYRSKALHRLRQKQQRILAMKIKSLILLALTGLSLAIAGCNTTAGMGRDLNSAGHAITDSAEDAKH